MNAAEDRLSELMDAATSALDPPIESILAAGERLGRSRRRRRHVAVAAGAAVVVLLAGGGVVAGMHDIDADHNPDYDAAGHVTSPSQSGAPIAESRAPAQASTPTAVPTSTAALAKPGEIPINATAAVNILRELVATNWKFGSYPPSSPGSLLRVNVDDGGGVAQIFVDMASDANSGMDPIDCSLQDVTAGSTNAAGVQPSCRIVTNARGDKAMEEVLTSPQSKIVIYRIIVNRTDGVALEITAQNGDPTSTAQEVTRTMPPLNIAVWGMVALSRVWQPDVPAALAK